MRIRYFAWLKHRVGLAEETLRAPGRGRHRRGAQDFSGQRHPGFAEALANPGVVRCAVNQEYVPEDAPLRADDEVAFFPPVTGG